MSRMMLLGVLRMPLVMVQGDFLSLAQYVDRGHEAAQVIEFQDEVVRAAVDLAMVLTLKDGPLDADVRESLNHLKELLGSLALSDLLRADQRGAFDTGKGEGIREG